jgi:hypothetical protein
MKDQSCEVKAALCNLCISEGWEAQVVYEGLTEKWKVHFVKKEEDK